MLAFDIFDRCLRIARHWWRPRAFWAPANPGSLQVLHLVAYSFEVSALVARLTPRLVVSPDASLFRFPNTLTCPAQPWSEVLSINPLVSRVVSSAVAPSPAGGPADELDYSRGFAHVELLHRFGVKSGTWVRSLFK